MLKVRIRHFNIRSAPAKWDISVPAEQFTALSSLAQRIFITENEVNGLAFPNVESELVIFGLGYSLDVLSGVNWMKDRKIYYWGDIDTHGFAMLDRLRSMFPSAYSFLMDRETLLAHRSLWSHESIPHIGVLTRLREAERILFEDLHSTESGKASDLNKSEFRLAACNKQYKKFSVLIRKIGITRS